MRHAEQMSKGELEYKAKIIESNDNGWKDEFVLVLVSLPILFYWVGLFFFFFSDDPEIRNKLDLFFEYFKNLPYWYQAIFIGVVSADLWIKGADIMRKKIMLKPLNILESAAVQMPMKTVASLILLVAAGVFAYTELS